MAYRARRIFADPDEAVEILSKLPDNGEYRANGSFYQRKPSVLFSEHSLEDAVRETYQLATNLYVSINYDAGTISIRGNIGPFPTSSMKGKFERPNWEDFREFLEQTGDWS